MKIAIVEDEAVYRTQLQDYLRRYQQEFHRPLEVSSFDSGVAFLHQFKSQFDIILLDVAMPFLDGIETAKKIRSQDGETVILFVTNQAQHAIRGYEVDAMDYILKPISYFAFSQRLNRAVSRVSRREEPYLLLNLRAGPRKMKISAIRYIESEGHSLVFHTAEGEFIIAGSMKDLEQKLGQYHFIRCNKGLLVSLRHVDGVRDGCAMVDGRELPISRPRKSAFMDALTNYFGGSSQ